jgi:YbgC/YbaW family acyl-CoA thioester hydrolase
VRFLSTIRVRFYELDPYDHVNHTAYIGYFETGRVEALQEMGFGIDVMKQAGYQIVLIELQARFHASATLQDLLSVSTEVVEVGRATSGWHQELRKGEELIATLDVKGAFTNLSGRPVRPPAARG